MHQNMEAKEEKEGEECHDHVSDLPDDLIAYILSLLHNTQESIKTSSLSRRWRHPWKFTRSLYFEYPLHMDNKLKKYFPNFVDTALHLRHGTSSVDNFNLWFDYKTEDAQQVDSWIHYAVTHNTRSLLMSFAATDWTFHSARLGIDCTPYELPPCFYSINASLEILALKFCKLETPPSSRFNSLLEVNLVCVSLGDGAIRNLTSTSPCLRHLTIDNCTWMGSIQIDNHPNLEVIKIHKVDGSAGDITIHGPNLKWLTLIGTILMGCCRIKELSSAVVLFLHFEEMFYSWDGEYNDTDAARLVEFLGRHRHVPIRMRLCNWCIQVLSIRGVIERALGVNIPLLNVTELDLQTNLREWELPEIAYLLKSCLGLQKLTININTSIRYTLYPDFLSNYNFKYWKDREMSSSGVIEHLTDVKINGFMRHAYLCANEIQEVIMSIWMEVEFIRFLLKNLVALEKMTISTIRETDLNMLLQKLEPRSEIIEEIFVILKACPKIEIVF